MNNVTATVDGAGIWIGNASTLNFTNVKANKSSAGNNGGLIYSDESDSITLNTIESMRCTAGNGGYLYLVLTNANTVTTMENYQSRYGSATIYDGFIYAKAPNAYSNASSIDLDYVGIEEIES